MATIATLGPVNSHAYQAALSYLPEAELKVYPVIPQVIEAFEKNEADFAVIPIYNTREDEAKNVRCLESLKNGYWIDNILQDIHLSLGTLDQDSPISVIVGTRTTLNQCQEYISTNYPEATLMTVKNLQAIVQEINEKGLTSHGVIESEKSLKSMGFTIRQREMADYNRTRFAVLGPEFTVPTAYYATALITSPLNDRVGLLYDILAEFSQRGINIMDLHTETDIKTQKLQFYIELEGHIDDTAMQGMVMRLENHIIQEPKAIKVLGSYPRMDMRTKHITTFGFIGSGDMSLWFARKLESEGYTTLVTGRSTELRPEEMINQVEVVAVCVPISATVATVEQYAPLLKDGQALILLAGEAETTINAALTCSREGVEVMLVHNLWGPQAGNMKDKNASVVRTRRSGPLCSEFEGFLYKHGADINHDSPTKHDMLMGVSQKLPTAISMAMAMALKNNKINPDDIDSHSTLTSLYGILAMSRIHAQNPRTYAEILATKGESRKIVANFAENLTHILTLAEQGSIDELCSIIDTSKSYLTDEFLADRMEQSLAVDQTLGKILQR